jgi:hypothetical protein
MQRQAVILIKPDRILLLACGHTKAVRQSRIRPSAWCSLCPSPRIQKLRRRNARSEARQLFAEYSGGAQ